MRSFLELFLAAIVAGKKKIEPGWLNQLSGRACAIDCQDLLRHCNAFGRNFAKWIRALLKGDIETWRRFLEYLRTVEGISESEEVRRLHMYAPCQLTFSFPRQISATGDQLRRIAGSMKASAMTAACTVSTRRLYLPKVQDPAEAESACGYILIDLSSSTEDEVAALHCHLQEITRTAICETLQLDPGNKLWIEIRVNPGVCPPYSYIP